MTTTTPAAPTLDLIPSHEEQMLRETVFGIASDFGPPYYKQCVKEGRGPLELWQALGERGYLGVHLPEEWGGGGQGLLELVAVLEETAAAGCPLLSLLVSPGIIGTMMSRHGTDEQKDRWLRGIASADLRFAFALTEPDAGTNSQNLSTVARRDTQPASPAGTGADRYIINGQKTYISGVDECDHIVVVVRTGEVGQLSLLVVDPDAPGLERQLIPTATEEPELQYTLYFDDVETPADHLLGEEGKGLRVAFDGLNPERILAAAVAVGIARFALGRACDYARERKVWSTPIGAHQAIAHPLAEGKIMMEQSRLLMQKAAALYDARLDAGEAANSAKLAAADAGVFCLDHAIQTHGGNGVALEYDLTTYWFLTRLLKIAPVSREMVLNYVSEHVLGLPRSY